MVLIIMTIIQKLINIQVVTNVCATSALLGVLLNIQDKEVKISDKLLEFKEFTKDFNSVVSITVIFIIIIIINYIFLKMTLLLISQIIISIYIHIQDRGLAISNSEFLKDIHNGFGT